MQMRCDVAGMPLEGPARPSIHMDFTALGSVTGALGVTISSSAPARTHAATRSGESVNRCQASSPDPEAPRPRSRGPSTGCLTPTHRERM